MWLLNTEHAALEFFPSPEAVPGGYAILSHTWGPEKEQTFQDLRVVLDLCKVSSENPLTSSHVSLKIRECCRVAKERGFEWVWIDTCCIDKTSSIELSEAINSMFRWYASAEVCLAYLDDVPAGCNLDAEDSDFRKARWFGRGWTLQELIAPLNLLFLNKDWCVIGTKVEHARLLEQITGVRAPVLLRRMHFTSVSIAERMHWASKRTTSRVEDEAYCLLGLFDVSIPSIYGEGHRAFQRLQ